jgi:peptidoglycan/LPS O-acetylase OafA/YrhL
VTVLAAVVTLAVALVSWRFFEGPLIARGHRYSYLDNS